MNLDIAQFSKNVFLKYEANSNQILKLFYWRASKKVLGSTLPKNIFERDKKRLSIAPVWSKIYKYLHYTFMKQFRWQMAHTGQITCNLYASILLFNILSLCRGNGSTRRSTKYSSQTVRTLTQVSSYFYQDNMQSFKFSRCS